MTSPCSKLLTECFPGGSKVLLTENTKSKTQLEVHKGFLKHTHYITCVLFDLSDVKHLISTHYSISFHAEVIVCRSRVYGKRV